MLQTPQLHIAWYLTDETVEKRNPISKIIKPTMFKFEPGDLVNIVVQKKNMVYRHENDIVFFQQRLVWCERCPKLYGWEMLIGGSIW